MRRTLTAFATAGLAAAAVLGGAHGAAAAPQITKEECLAQNGRVVEIDLLGEVCVLEDEVAEITGAEEAPGAGGQEEVPGAGGQEEMPGGSGQEETSVADAQEETSGTGAEGEPAAG